MKITIRVSFQNIQLAESRRQNKPDYRSCEDCPIALAARRVFSTYDDVRAGGSTLILRTMDYKPDFISLPEKARQFIRDFDNRLLVEPFEFEVET